MYELDLIFFLVMIRISAVQPSRRC